MAKKDSETDVKAEEKTKSGGSEKSKTGKKIDWDKLKHEYVTGNITYQGLSDKYGVSLESIKKHARKTDKRQGWVTLKRKHRNKVYAKVEQKAADIEAKKILSNREKIKNAGEGLLDEAIRALSQVSDYIVKHETKTTKSEIQGNVKEETVTTVKDIEIVDGKVDTKSLKNIAETLLKVKELLSESEEVEKCGIIEIPAMEVLVPPSDDEETGAIDEKQEGENG